MADANTSSDYLPQISRDRADSNMSLGPGITLTDNGGISNGAGPLASPIATGPPDTIPPATKATTMMSPEDEKLVQNVLTSEVNTGRIHENNKSCKRTDGSLDRCCYYAQQAQAEHRIRKGMVCPADC